MEDFDEINKELESISPILGKIPRLNPFRVDEKYFDELPMYVMDRIAIKKARKWFNLSWLMQPRWVIAMAICIIAIVFGSFFMIRNLNADRPMPIAQVKQLLVEPLNNDNVIDNVDADDLVDALTTEQQQNPNQIIKKHADKKAIEDYILDNVDESAIIDAL